MWCWKSRWTPSPASRRPSCSQSTGLGRGKKEDMRRQFQVDRWSLLVKHTISSLYASNSLLLEKFRVASMVVRMAPFSFRRALNFLRQSTVSWRCRVEATRSRWQIHGCFSASAAVMRFAGFTVSIELIRFFASGVTVSHSGEGYWGERECVVREVQQKRASHIHHRRRP